MLRFSLQAFCVSFLSACSLMTGSGFQMRPPGLLNVNFGDSAAAGFQVYRLGPLSLDLMLRLLGAGAHRGSGTATSPTACW